MFHHCSTFWAVSPLSTICFNVLQLFCEKSSFYRHHTLKIKCFSSIFSEPEWTLYLLKTCLELPLSMELGHMRHYLLLPWFWIYTYNPSCQEKSKTVRKGERSKCKIQQLQQNKKRLLHPSRVQYLVEE